MTATRCAFAMWLVTGAALGCGNEPAAPEMPPTPTAVPAPPPAVPAPAPAPPDDTPPAVALAVPADFEDEASTEITAQTYRASLDTLEKELDTDLAADPSR